MQRIKSFRWNFFYRTGNRRHDHKAGTLTSVAFTERTGRKDYWCVECGRSIPAGTIHLADANSSARLHKHCGIAAEPVENERPPTDGSD